MMMMMKDPESVTDLLSSSAEQEFLQEFMEKLVDHIDSDDDVLLRNLSICANCQLALGRGHIACDNCQVTVHSIVITSAV